jgi:diguanylate cyclase (GGDEF)-like protein
MLMSTVRVVSIVAAVIGALTAVAGIAFGSAPEVLVGLAAIGYAAWLRIEVSRPVDRFGEGSVVRIALATITLIAFCVAFQPWIGPALTVAAVVPVVLALPFASVRSMAILVVAGGIVGVGAFLAGIMVPTSGQVPVVVENGLTTITFICSMVFLLVFLWQVGLRLKDTVADLRSVVTMSSDLAKSLDPQLVGDGIALHIARAVGSDDCTISFWDRDGDRVVSLGFYPPDRRDTLDDTYALADFPATRAMLVDQTVTVIEVDDGRADPAEVAYLRSFQQRSMVMIPLVAMGTTIGLIELGSARSGLFDARRIELAQMLAQEAAMGLENARLYDKVRHQAFHDALTGLANRVLFRDHVEAALADVSDGDRVAVMFIDLDSFKEVNDRLGHARGDQVLVQASERIRACLRDGDLAARLGGDEFAVLVADVPTDEVALAVASRLLDAIHRPFDLGDATADLDASIGVATSGSDARTMDDLLRNADVAMYAAKSTVRDGVELFRPALRDAMAVRSERASRLRGAVERGELRLDYQPIVDLEGHRLVGFEALVRWQAPGRPLAMPADFIGLAEETGEIIPIGRWVLREACRQARDWQLRLGVDDLEINVNLSARQFADPSLVETVDEALSDAGLAAAQLVLEITESTLMQHTTDTVARLAEFRQRGVRIAIDDFGTGYSSLSYLERFAVDILKIDRSFVGGLDGRIDQPVLASAIVELGRALGLEVVAEGIERTDQRDALVRLGCRLGQGYLFGRPLGAEAAEAVLAGYPAGRPDVDRGLDGSRLDSRPADRRALRLVSGD